MKDTLHELAHKTHWTPYDEAVVLKMEWQQRAELAKLINCQGLLVDLSLDLHAEVREGAAKNPHTPLDTLLRLSEQDLCSSVRNAAKETLASRAADIV